MLYYGACYYPEHWTADQARDHIALMKKARLNLVRMAEFAWCRFEPAEGEFRFDWLDPVIEELHQAGVATLLCTPTCIPPMWAQTRHPEIFMQEADGRVKYPGARNHCCKNAPAYRRLCDRIVEEMARHYAGMPGVIGWQTDNELGNHGSTRCYCPHCEEAFRRWLRERYGDLETLNAAWGAAFWGLDFHDWAEVPLPRRMPTGSNPGHYLDFARFSSDTQLAFHQTQYETLKRLCPAHFVTHNGMGRFAHIDYYRLGALEDFPSWDNYPDRTDDLHEAAYAHEITRSLGGPFWVMEQKSGPTGNADSGLLGEQPEPGDIRRWAWQVIANGGDGLVYFRWRACLHGAEQYWHGILDHDGIPRRRLEEVAQTGEEFAKVAPLLEGTRVMPKVAIIRSYETLWSLERQPGARGFSYDEHCYELFRAVRRAGHHCDFVDPRADLTRYAVVLAPSLAIVDEIITASLEAFARRGGTLILFPQSGIRTPENAIRPMPRPGLLAPLAGLTIEEVRPYHRGQTHTVSFLSGPLTGRHWPIGTWAEILDPGAAEVIAEYTDGSLAHRPAITRHDLGQGQAFYIGVYLPAEGLEPFLAALLPDPFIHPFPKTIEVTQREGESGRFIFLINHGPARETLKLPAACLDLLTGRTLGPELALAPNEVRVLKA